MDEREIYSEIIKNNAKREGRTLSKYACRSLQGIRLFPEREEMPDRENIRPVFFHDGDRIIHSRAYTRYIDKTQVFFLFDNDHITHRVLHVQLVSKIGRMIGRCLKLNEDLIEAIALGHDIGHVPYGHDGESYIDEICSSKGFGYFCHNAQSVRSLMELEDHGRGLNLTLQVLDGVLAHNGEQLQSRYEPDTGKDWDRFLDEYSKCWKVKNFSTGIVPMTLEGCVVKVSDIISYIGRDIEDAMTVRMIKREDIPKGIVKVLGNNNRDIINKLIRDIVLNSYDKPYLRFSKDVYDALNELFDFNRERIYNNPFKTKENGKIKNMFKLLFETYIKQLNEKDESSLIYGEHLKEMSDSYKENNSNARIVVDYIAGMTDSYFNRQFNDLVLPRKFGRYIKK
ncbi:MAG: HD domain-containing protein [Clostridiales bacterium]|nr:HD domain-containing protein [Clostridiales bacterium]